jgi:hypothetical protein
MPDIDDLIVASSAMITRRAAPAELLVSARDRAPDPSVFDEFPPFLWQSEISSDRLDAFYTVMDADTTLVNYAADAAAGVAILIGHNTRELPVGQSLTGTLERTGTGARVLSDAYALIEPATAPIVNRIKAGIARDISVGFSTRGAQCLCSICGRDMWRDWDCWHIPGFEYEVTQEGAPGSAGAKVMVLCTGRIVNAHLAEYSLVYDGATPGAAVLQAQRAAEAGRLSPQQARLLEQRYRINLPGTRIAVPGATGGRMGAEQNGREQAAATLDERALQTLCERAGVPSDRTGLARIEWMVDRIAELTPRAKDGETYRADLVTAALAEAVRAFGAEAEEEHRAGLEASSLAHIKRMTAAWKQIADAALPAGRKSQDAADAPADQQTAAPVLPGLYRS